MSQYSLPSWLDAAKALRIRRVGRSGLNVTPRWLSGTVLSA